MFGILPEAINQALSAEIPFLARLLVDLCFFSYLSLCKVFTDFCVSSNRTPNNIYIGQMKISKFTMINKQTIFTSAKQTLIMTSKKFFLLSNS